MGASKCVPVCSPVLMSFQYQAGPRSSYRLISCRVKGTVLPNGSGSWSIGVDDESGKQWLDLVRGVAVSASGPEYQANENTDCDRCPAKGSCPIRPEGRQVTGS